MRHGDEVLGALVVRERPGVAMTPVEERLFAGLADQAGLVLRGARLRTELELRLAALSTRAEELRVSRERLVDAHDAERRRLERDIHDGAQQHLVALAVNLRLAGTLAGRSPDRADALLAEQERAGTEAIATLVRLARGIFPPRLEAAGVAEALRPAVEAMGPSVELRATGVGRYPPAIEATAYFCCLEALQNAAKHAQASSTRVALRRHRGHPRDQRRGRRPRLRPRHRPGRHRSHQHPRTGRVRRRLAHRQLGPRARHPDPRRAAGREPRRERRPRHPRAGLADGRLVTLDVVVSAQAVRSGPRRRSPCTASRSSTARSSARP